MNKRELTIKTISDEFARWQVRIENINSLNLYDSNLFSENSICDILNAIFDYKLKNVNQILKNHPSIDLADTQNRIAVQVTSTKSKLKIQSTLDTFFKNKLEKNFDELFIIILGKKQKSYSKFNVLNEFQFDEDKNILDFKGLLKFINFLPTKKIENIAILLEQEHLPKNSKTSSTNAIKIKKRLALKKKLKNDLLIDLEREHWSHAGYEPYIRFKYHNVIIRSVNDTSWPNVNESEKGEMSTWFKGEFWNFYENGLELVSFGGRSIFDKNGNWDILDWKKDTRETNSNYKIVPYHTFLRIPYEYIVDYDMEPDAYHGVPTIYVDYAKNNMPYEEILYGILGKYEKDNFTKSKLTHYFDNSKKKQLE